MPIGVYVRTKEYRDKMSARKKGYVFSEEHKRHISEAKMGHFVSDESKRKMSESRLAIREHLGYILSPKTRQKIADKLRGRKRPEHIRQMLKVWEFKKDTPIKGYGWHHSEITKQKIAESQKGIPRPYIRGQNHYNWQGGITPFNAKIRGSLDYRNWRSAVFERDDYRCFNCGERGGFLHAHHIYPFAQFPRLRLLLENGITLCRNCHKRPPSELPRPIQFAIAWPTRSI